MDLHRPARFALAALRPIRFLSRIPRRSRFCPLVLGALVLIARLAACAADAATNPRYSGTPTMRVWTAEELGSPAMVYRVLQHPQSGLVYIGTNVGIVELDGVRIRIIRREPFDAAAIQLDGRGRLWKGASHDIQVSTPDAAGEWQTVSYRDRPVPGHAPISLAYHSVRGPAGVYFVDLHRLYHFADTEDVPTPRVWKAAESPVAIARLWLMDATPYVALTDNTVLRLRDNELERVPGLTSPVFAARAQPGGGWQLLGATGVDFWDGVKRAPVTRPLGEDLAQRGLFLADGRIVFGTQSSGVVVCDRDGRFLQQINRERGLPDNYVRDLMEDREGGLWVALFNSVARIELDSPYARHGPREALEGIPQCFAEHGGALHVGTTEGLFRREPDGRFTRIHGLEPPVRKLLSHGEHLFILATRLHVLGPNDGDRARPLDDRHFLGLVPLETIPGVFFYGCNEGVAWARFDGTTWKQEGLLATMTGLCDVVFQGPPGVIWARSTVGMWRFDLRGGLSPTPPEVKLTPERGLPHRDVRLFQLGDRFVLITQDGGRGQMLRFEEATGTVVPELRLAGLPKSPRYPAAAGEVDRVVTDEAGAVWLQMPEPLRAVYRAEPAGPDRWRAELLPGPTLAATRANAIWPERATRTFWTAAPSGLWSRDLDWRPAHEPAAPAALVRRVVLASGKSIYGGATLPRAKSPPSPFRLNAHDDALRVGYAAPVFTADELGKMQVTYRTRLDGLNPGWSDWTTETHRDYTNLPWRDFTFRVQARDGAGRVGPEGTFAFSIAAPWWGTRWAWTGYAALGLLAVAGVVRLRTQALHRRAAQLERIVADRTGELAQSNAQLATQNAELARLHRLELDEKIAAQLSEEKARLELLRYQLNPHFLLNAFTTLRGLVFSSPESAGQVVERLADFCRLALTRSEETGATVDDEVRLIESYLDTEKARWRDELQVELHVDPAARPRSLPPFLLQPLVENAIKYGGRTSPGTLRVRVSISCQPDVSGRPTTPASSGLLIEIANTGAWVEGDSPHRRGSTGIGLENLRQRLRRRYRDAHEFTTEARDGWVWVRLRIWDRAPVNGEKVSGPV